MLFKKKIDINIRITPKADTKFISGTRFLLDNCNEKSFRTLYRNKRQIKKIPGWSNNSTCSYREHSFDFPNSYLMPRDPYKKIDPVLMGIIIIAILATIAVVYIITRS